jgi:ATP-binding protein involved in chromosome partitioning
LDIRIREDADGGHPSVAADPDGAVAKIYRDIARRVAAALALRGRDYTHKFPNIVIQNT